MDWRGADVYETEAPLGVNGLDDLIERDGDAAFWQLVDEARPMRRYQSPIKKLTPEQRKERAKKIQAAVTPEQRLSAVVGKKAQKQMFRLWSEAGLSAESQHLLSAFHVLMADTGNPDATEYDFEYRELFPLLYRTNGYYKKGKLKSAGSKKIRDRVKKLEAEQDMCRITFAIIKPARKDSEGEIIDSHVKLFSQNHIAEIEAQAAESSGFKQGYRNSAREKATIEWVKENAGAAYIEKPEKHRTQNQRISDGLGRIEGNVRKTAQRMRERGDTEDHIWLALCEVLPRSFLDFVIEKGNSLYKEIDVTPTDPIVVDDDDFPHTEPEPDTSKIETQKTEKVVTQKQDLNQTESTDDSMYFDRNTYPQHTPEDVALWDRVCQKSADARAEKEAEQKAARDAVIAEPLPEPGEWENPHPDESTPDEFDLPEIRCHCGAELKPMATSCVAGCSYTSFYWSEYCLRSYGIIRDAIWHSVDSDRPVTIKLPAIRGEDGRRWVSSHMNNSKTFFPVDEIEFVKEERAGSS